MGQIISLFTILYVALLRFNLIEHFNCSFVFFYIVNLHISTIKRENKVKKYIYSVSVIVLMLFTSCDINNDYKESVDLRIENDANELSKLVQKVERPLSVDGSTASKSTSGSIKAAPTMTVVTEIAAPSIPAGGLSASHIAIVGTRMYVTYHLNNGSDNTSFGGGIQIFDFATETMVSSATNEAIDWNYLLVDQASDRLLIAGENNAKGAILHEVATSGGSLTVGTNEVINLGGVSANAVVRTQNIVFVTTGGTDINREPGVYAFEAGNLSGEPSYYASTGLKQVTYHQTEQELMVLRENTGANGELIIFDSQTILNGTMPQLDWLSALDEIMDMGAPITPERGRNAVHVATNDVVFVPLGQNGIKVVDVLNGRNNVTDTETVNGTVNSVSSDDNFVYACLSNGFSIYSRNASRGTRLDFEGKVSESSFVADPNDIPNVSINQATTFSYNGNDYVAVAAGRAGVKIIRID